jgi:AbrB family looped-hinge helix DNA binding protein
MAHIAEASKTEKYRLQLGERGRIVLPAPVRERLKLNPGDRLILIVDESGDMKLVSLNHQIDKCRGMFADIAPDRILSEELIADRREEVRLEELE